MSLDPSLKAANALIRHRNVLKRDERLAKLKEEEKWQTGGKILGLPKVSHRKAVVGGKVAKEETAEGATATAAAPAAKGAAPAKGGAPAKGAAPAAKAGAPAAKAAPAAKGKK